MERLVCNIRGVAIGDGRPKICVPVMFPDESGAAYALDEIGALPFDMAEWRLDSFEPADDPEAVKRASLLIRETIGERPLLITFRTQGEGGNGKMGKEEYVQLLSSLAEEGIADLLDVELFTLPEKELKQLLEKIHACGLRAVVSSHDFQKTPGTEEIVGRLVKMQELGADITKIAVMPKTREDTVRLLEASVLMKENHADRPYITMAMGRDGAVSRMIGSFTGSAVTFACGEKASAPGQIPAGKMREILDLLGEI